MVSSSEIRDRIAKLLGARIDLGSFEDWLVQNTWNIHQSGSQAAESLTFEIEELLSEHSDEHISEQQLLNQLSTILYGETQTIYYLDPSPARFSTKALARVSVVDVKS